MILVRQRSALDASGFEVVDAQERHVGEIRWPWLAQARNARLRWHPEGSAAGDVQLQLLGEDFRVRHAYLNRRRHPDMRWTLQKGEGVLASADVCVLAGFRRVGVQIHSPFAGYLTRDGHWWKRSWGVWAQGSGPAQPLGTIAQPGALMLRQAWALRLPADMGLPMQLFLAALVLQMR